MPAVSRHACSLLVLLSLAGCGTAQPLTPQQELVYAAFNVCTREGRVDRNAQLARVAPDGRYWYRGLGEGAATSSTQTCMSEKVQFELEQEIVKLYGQGQYSAAIPLAERMLATREKVLGPEHVMVATGLNNLAELYREQSLYAQAEPLHRRALAIREKALGPEHPDVAWTLNNLALLHEAQGDFARAEPLHQRALAIREKARGPEHSEVATSLNNLALLHQAQGQYREAERLHRRALAIWEKVLGPEHRGVAVSLNNLAELYRTQGLYAQAEPLQRRALAIWEKALGPEHPDVALSLNNLAESSRDQGQYADAEALYQRALAIREKALGAEHPEVAATLNNLALLHHVQRHYEQAERLNRRALAIWEKALGPEHRMVATSLVNLAEVYGEQRQYAQAEPLHQRALAIREKVLGADHPDVATSLNNLALLYQAQNRSAEAVRLHRRAFAIFEKVLGSEHPNVAASLNSLAYSLASQGQVAEARQSYGRARDIMLAVRRSNVDLGEEARRALFQGGRAGLQNYANLLAGIARSRTSDATRGSAIADAFMVVEQARSGAAEAALAKAGARVAATEPGSAELARQVEDLRYRRQAAQKRLTAELASTHDTSRLTALRQSAQQLDRDLAAAVDRLLKAFPEYAELAVPEPIDVPAVQSLLRPDEALLSFFTLSERVLVWLVRPGRPPAYRDIAIKKADLASVVSRVRISVDQSRNSDLTAGLVPFDVAGAHELYKLLFEPLRSDLAGVKHLLVVPDDVLLPLPFAALVTRGDEELAGLYARNARADQKDVAAYARVSWLAKEYAVSTLPTATSLRALRRSGRPGGSETEPLIAFGDPVLQGRGLQRGGRLRSARDAPALLNELRMLDRLPGTREELLAVANALGADPGRALHLGARATKPTVMALNRAGRLGKARVLAFATHGLLASDLAELAQPALVLTPPNAPSAQDDGLLRLDDVLDLKLTSTEWTILSACQTASDDGSGEGLSGLTRAFLFAGTRSVLVSHWSVEDRATQALMTEVFRRYAGDSTLSRAEALRQGMLGLIGAASGSRSYFAHPFAWAPFFLVGEGGKEAR
jgi:CHAT domain-containing protein